MSGTAVAGTSTVGLTDNTGLASAAAKSTAEEQKGQFLNLLVTQLRYQDPMNPMQGTEFTQQLAMFSSLEQLININKSLAGLGSLQSAFAQSQAVGMLGKQILAEGNTVTVSGGTASNLAFSLCLSGPPGTGKSQTITNIIGEFLAGGKRILFVSEKMAALEVVQRRLHEAGLGGFCLQLHSHKRDKREVVDELVQALEAPTLQMKPAYQDALSELESARKVLNAYVRALHQPRFNLQLTVFRAHGEMARLHGAPEVTFSIGDITKVDGNELSKRIGVLDAAVVDEVDEALRVHLSV